MVYCTNQLQEEEDKDEDELLLLELSQLLSKAKDHIFVVIQ